MLADIVTIGSVNLIVAFLASREWRSEDFGDPIIRHATVAVIQLFHVRSIVLGITREFAGCELPAAVFATSNEILPIFDASSVESTLLG